MAACKTILMTRFPFICSKSILAPRNLFVNHCENESLSVKTGSKKLGLPEKPKRPLTPYFKFMSIMRPQILEKYKVNKPTEIIKLLSEEWSKTDEETKKAFKREYDNDMLDYVNNMIKYEQSLSPQQKEALIESKIEKKQINLLKERKKKQRELNKPKKPLNKFMLFVGDQFVNKPSGLNYFEWRRQIAKKWHSLPEDEKEKYAEKSKKLTELYRENIAKWEEKMIRDGHTDVVHEYDLFDKKKKRYV